MCISLDPVHIAHFGGAQVRFFPPGDGLPGFPWIPIVDLKAMIVAYAGPAPDMKVGAEMADIFRPIGARVGTIDILGQSEWAMSCVSGTVFAQYIAEWFDPAFMETWWNETDLALTHLANAVPVGLRQKWFIDLAIREPTVREMDARILARADGRSPAMLVN